MTQFAFRFVISFGLSAFSVCRAFSQVAAATRWENAHARQFGQLILTFRVAIARSEDQICRFRGHARSPFSVKIFFSASKNKFQFFLVDFRRGF
jgi:hypothetical protein